LSTDALQTTNIFIAIGCLLNCSYN